MSSNRYEYSDQVKEIFEEIRALKKAEQDALWCLNPKNNPSKDHYPVLEELYRFSIVALLSKIARLIVSFIEDGCPVFKDPTIGRKKQ